MDAPSDSGGLPRRGRSWDRGPRPLRLLVRLAWIGVMLASALVVIVAVTWTTRATAAALALMATHAHLAVARFGREPPWRGWGRWAWRGATLLAAVVLILAVARAPLGHGGDDGILVEHVFTRADRRFERFAISNIVPEVDQVRFGIAFTRLLDPNMDGRRATRVWDLASRVYAEAEADPAFADMGSVMGWAYAEMLGRPFDVGHYVAIVPRRPEGTRVPAIVFVHGSVGNFASYWEALAPLAREDGFAVLAPSFGFGNWQRPGGTTAVLEAIDDACRRYPIDPSRVWLVGLSNGGRAATRIVAAKPGTVRGIVLLSAVVEDGSLQEGIYRGSWRGLPVLFIHGTEDERVSFDRARSRVATAGLAGARVEELALAGEDHFALFARRAEILRRIADWIASQEAAPIDAPRP